MARLDPHSYADDAQPLTRHFEWHAQLDFTARRIHATIELFFREPTSAATVIDLDTRALDIRTVTDGSGTPLQFELSAADPVLGSKLRIHLNATLSSIRLAYVTAADASALQWLEPSQTLGGRHPYVFSQCQAIHARSLIPCQDTPAIRVSYAASLSVPGELTAVMASAPLGRTTQDDRAIFRFDMPQPIPPYLLAFAVGDLASKDLSPRSRVWSEPGLLDAAAWEFAEVEKHLHAAESLFGAYDWERFDLLVMPPSFPYGGMENPRLTFLTPTLIAGDRSLVSVVAHELAHSWTGNLVTNSNAEHFWLNEGFTVFAERRIVEALSGVEEAQLHAALGRQELDLAIATFEKNGAPQMTSLRTHLTGVDPDEAFSVVPYEKGYLFLCALEQAMGRPSFDGFLKSWLAAHRFGSATTEQFVEHCQKTQPGLLERVNAEAWLNHPGVPANAPVARSTLLDAVNAAVGSVPEAAAVTGWSATQWQLFLDSTPRTLSGGQLALLDARFGLSASKNTEILVSWLTLALESGHFGVMPAVTEVVTRVGRMKYLKPLFGALLAKPETKPQAKALYDQVHTRWHPIAQQVISGLIQRAG